MPHTYLVMKTPGEADRLIVWDTRTLPVGRSPENAIVLSESDVSRRHAIFMKEGDRCEVGDHQTGNGTFVNGEAVSGSRPIRHGDVIAVGKVEFHFCETDEHPAKRGMKLEYASHLMTGGMLPQGGNPNATMVGIMDSMPDDSEEFIIEHNDGTGSDLLADGPLELDQLAPAPAPVKDLDLDFANEAASQSTTAPPQAPAPQAPARPAPQAPASPPAADPNASGAVDPLERMRQLKSLHAEGLITDEEFRAKRAEILDRV
jgi:hypothetical protein